MTTCEHCGQQVLTRPNTMSVTQVAAMLGVSRRTVVNWADAGKLPLAFRTVGGHRRFAAVDVERVAAELRERAA